MSPFVNRGVLGFLGNALPRMYFADVAEKPKAGPSKKRRHPRHDRLKMVGRVRKKHHRHRKAA